MAPTNGLETPGQIKLLPSQAGLPTIGNDWERYVEAKRSTPIPYTGSPLRLCLSDLALFVQNAWSIPGVLYPFYSPTNTEYDELYPSSGNIFCLVLHGFLIVLETFFLLSLGFVIFLPLWATLLYLGAVFLVVFAVSGVLNGSLDEIRSTVSLKPEEISAHAQESWIFLNGVSVGQHWLLGNVNRLSLTFRRPILGIPNRTYGIIFDLLQCIIERDFCYATSDIRSSYAALRKELLKEDCKKVVLISHSQGALEASLLLDWLLAELPSVLLQKLEIYTFGCAANHFNNPSRNPNSIDDFDPKSKAFRHIEHYVHTGDFVARWGALTFSQVPNRFMGRVFIRPATGHLMNQHYLHDMFPFDPRTQRVTEKGGFMEMEVEVDNDDGAVNVNGVSTGNTGGKHQMLDLNTRESFFQMMTAGGTEINGGSNGHSFESKQLVIEDGGFMKDLMKKRRTVGDLSRLWCYRNGGSPTD